VIPRWTGSLTGLALDWLATFAERCAGSEAQRALFQLLLAEGRCQASACPRGLPAAELPLVVHAAAGGDGTPLALAGCGLCLYLGADVLDDVVDRELSPRWASHGPSQALIAAVTFVAPLAARALAALDVPPATRLALADALIDAHLTMSAGESADLAFEGRTDVMLADCDAMVQDKSGAEWAFFARAGAILAGATPEVCEAYTTFGRELGVTSQILSDCADLAGADGVSHDLTTGKRTLPIVYALATLPDVACAELLGHLAAAPHDPLRCLAVRRLLDQAGAFHYGALAAEVHRRRALAALGEARPAGPAAHALSDFAETLAFVRRPADDATPSRLPVLEG
jgi:geranylgeranyl diphosphate synthase, type I